METRATIDGISYWLPNKKLTNEGINKDHPEWAIDKIAGKTGIFSRGIASKEETVSDISTKAANLLFEEYNINREEIDFLILCTQSPDFLLPTTACIVQNNLGLKTDIGAFDFNLGCSGFVYGLSIADGLIKAGSAKSILLITAETYTKYIHPLDKSNKTIFGDAAAATLIRKNGTGLVINKFVFGTDGAGAPNLILRNGGQRQRELSGQDEFDDENIFVKNDNFLYMNGGEIFNFTSRSIPGLVKSVSEKNNVPPDEISLYVFHQANQFMLDHLRKKIGISEDKFFYYIKDCGNTVSSTIPIALKEAITKLSLQTHTHKILLAGFGVGYSWSATIIGDLKS
jgi:3-oxoacyl-[acyl-carrier-protein] synthase-3